MASISKRAWATLVTRPSYIPGVIILAHTLRKNGHSIYPLIVLVVPDTLPDEYVSLIERIDRHSTTPGLLQIRSVHPLTPSRPVSTVAKRFEDTWTKLRVFSLIEYDTLIYLDADMMVMHPEVDELFNFTLPTEGYWLGASHACTCNVDHDPWAPKEWNVQNCPHTAIVHPEALKSGVNISTSSPTTYHLMNSGTFIFNPSAKLWEGILSFLNTTELLETFAFPDQNFLDEYFRRRWTAIGWQWNAIKTMRYWHPNIWRDEEVKVLHYIVDKPWEKRVGKDGIAGYLGRDGVTHQWWWDEWDLLVSEIRNSDLKGKDSVLRQMNALVAPSEVEEYRTAEQSGSTKVMFPQTRSNAVTDANANYFTCTLGQAALINAKSPHNCKTILDLVDKHARSSASAPAVGFSVPAKGNDDAWGCATISYSELRQQSINLAASLSRTILPPTSLRAGSQSRTVAILASSSMDFLLTWLGLTRLGYPSLQIAPQCSAAAINHLCSTCDVSLLFHDESTYELAIAAAAQSNDKARPLRLCRLPLFMDDTEHPIEQSPATCPSLGRTPQSSINEDDVAYIHHSSGTSSGLPKPIPQTHRGAAASLPCFDNGSEFATFTTTPLYHGGVVDCLRAWSSGALIWLFPGKDVPITTANILKALEVATEAANRDSDRCPSVTYFSSVPYVLQMMADEPKGIRSLASMDLVGVGGAALPTGVGDSLVAAGVNLISRYGNVECGFLLSSYRDFSSDREWQYLRSHSGAGSLEFESNQDGLYELVVTKSWPQINRTNRQNGSFATADLFVSHPKMLHAWKYHSRADSQLVLSTGKKFDPGPMEIALASLSIVQDAFVFISRTSMAMIIIPQANSTDSEASYRVTLWPHIDQLNKENPPHARVEKAMIYVTSSEEAPLEKSSKGSILRKQAEMRFSALIADAAKHEGDADDSGSPLIDTVPDQDLLEVLLTIVNSVVGEDRQLTQDKDLFSSGIDSMACLRIRSLLQKKFGPSLREKLPLNIVYDCGTIGRLAEYLVRLRNGIAAEVEDDLPVMEELVERYGTIEEKEGCSIPPEAFTRQASSKSTVVFTGATGSLGASLLELLMRMESISHIYCLVRAENDETAMFRVSESLRQRQRAPMSTAIARVTCLSAELGEAMLGLSSTTYEMLASHATIIIHAAWAVNFNMKLRSYIPAHISGIHNLLQLALCPRQTSPMNFIFCSSTASVLGPSASSPVPELVSQDPRDASTTGYARSKWVAEAICAKVHDSTSLHNHIAILRIGQLTGDTKSGVWNVNEAWPLLLSSVELTGVLPDLDEPLSWLPVNIAAEMIRDVAVSSQVFPSRESAQSQESNGVPIYHLVNNDTSRTWKDLLRWIRKLHSPGFVVLSPRDWILNLEKLQESGLSHPAMKLIGLWNDAYMNAPSESTIDIRFETERTQTVVPSMKRVEAMNEMSFRMIYRWLFKVDRVEHT